MIQHKILSFIVILINQCYIIKITYNNKLMFKNKYIVNYIALLLKYLTNLFNIIRDINISYSLKRLIILNYPKKVHSISVRLHITSRRNKQVTHKFLSQL